MYFCIWSSCAYNTLVTVTWCLPLLSLLFPSLLPPLPSVACSCFYIHLLFTLCLPLHTSIFTPLSPSFLPLFSLHHFPIPSPTPLSPPHPLYCPPSTLLPSPLYPSPSPPSSCSQSPGTPGLEWLLYRGRPLPTALL